MNACKAYTSIDLASNPDERMATASNVETGYLDSNIADAGNVEKSNEG